MSDEGSYRDDLAAAHARIAELEGVIEELKRANEPPPRSLRAEVFDSAEHDRLAAQLRKSTQVGSLAVLFAIIASLGAGIASAVRGSPAAGHWTSLLLLAVPLVAAFVLAWRRKTASRLAVLEARRTRIAPFVRVDGTPLEAEPAQDEEQEAEARRARSA